MKHLAIGEIVIGLLLAAASSYVMIRSTLDHRSDLHGLVLSVALFGAALGALLAFAGSSLLGASRFRGLGHLPFWGGSYG